MLQARRGESPHLASTLDLSTNAWQFVDDLASRPTSSVLSSSDTEDEAPVAQQSGTDDDKTLVVNMNNAVQQHPLFTSECSSFILPDVSCSSGQKVLIIGHGKVHFYKSLEPSLRNKFTLNSNDEHKIVVVIFDGLLKIGNILNFIKHSTSGDKIFVPIVHNISYKIIEKMLKLYNVQLLCMPIPLEDEASLNNLLDLFRDDFLLEQSVGKFALVPVKRPATMDATQSMIVTHQTDDMKKSKKLKRRQTKRRFTLIGIGVTLGLGLGISIALTVSYFKKLDPPQAAKGVQQDGIKDALKSLVTATKMSVKHGDNIVKQGLIHFKRHVTAVSRLLFQGTREYMDDMKSSLAGAWINGDDYIHLLIF